jgi:hypothetical protein
MQFNAINGLAIGAGLISGLSAMYSPISLWPRPLKPIGLILGLGLAGLGVADAMGIVKLSDLQKMVPSFYATPALEGNPAAYMVDVRNLPYDPNNYYVRR